MPSTSQAAAEPSREQRDFYRFRDELARSYAPANAHERMLTTQIAQAWQRLEKAIEIERRYFEKHDPLEVIASNLDQFKAVTRYATDCERAWRHSVENLERVQRRRGKVAAAAHFAPSLRPTPPGRRRRRPARR